MLYYKTSEGMILKTTPDGVALALVSTYGVIDRQDDRMIAGVFQSATMGDPGRFRVLDQHQGDSATRTIATPKRVFEVGRSDLPAAIRSAYPSATGGLITENLFMLGVGDELSESIFRRLQSKALREWSVGFMPEMTRNVTETVDSQRIAVREIVKAELFEWSVVQFGAGITDTIQTKTQGSSLIDRFHARADPPRRKTAREMLHDLAEIDRQLERTKAAILRGENQGLRYINLELQRKCIVSMFDIEMTQFIDECDDILKEIK